MRTLYQAKHPSDLILLGVLYFMNDNSFIVQKMRMNNLKKVRINSTVISYRRSVHFSKNRMYAHRIFKPEMVKKGIFKKNNA
ncbi:hypothetical protein MASR1M74_00880 [Lentimicrobium sp.]